MFWEYYGKRLKYRVVLAVVLASIAVILGKLVLQEIVVPNFGVTVRQWLYSYYLLTAVSIVSGAVFAAVWLKYGLSYSNLKARRYLVIFICGAVTVTIVNMVLAAVFLPSFLEGGIVAILFTAFWGLCFYYLDAVFFALPPLRGFVPESGVLLAKVYGRFAADKLDVLREGEQEFFSDYLLLVPPGVAVKGDFKWEALYTVEWNGSQYKALYPLKPEISKYFPVDELQKYIFFTNVKEPGYDGLKVVVSIPYADGRFKPQLVSKLFTTGRIKVMTQAPVAAVWPDFVLQGLRRWNRYYFYYESAEKLQFHQFYLRPYWLEGTDFLREIYIGQEHCEVSSGTQYPEIITCMIDMDEPMHCGFLVTEKPRLVNVGYYKNGTFSVDFGTVNTTVCFASDTESVKTCQPGSRVKLLWQGDKAQEKLRQNFISPASGSGLEAWILSSFHIYNEDLCQNKNDLFKDGNIFYVNGLDDLGSLQNVLSELKWQHENTVYRQGFLNQLCAQCLAEAAASGITELSWRYSYPKAFTKAEWVRYGEIWKNVISLLNTLTGPGEDQAIRCSLDREHVVAESIALAAYCDKEERGALGKGSICMDIGGGSTDIVFWYGSEPDITWQDSLKFAGHHIIRDYLIYGHNCLLLKELCVSETLQKQVEELHKLACLVSSNNNRQLVNAFTIRLDALLKYGAEELLRNLSMQAAKSLQVKHFRSTVTFGLSGLFFYCGLIFGRLCKAGHYQKLHKFHLVYVGGNGSRLLDFAAAGNFNDDAALYKLLAQIFRDGVKTGAGGECFKELLEAMELQTIRIIKSSAPKEEIAAGLFCDLSSELGLKFAVDETVELLQPLWRDELLVDEQDENQGNFRQFMEHYNELALKFLQEKLHLRDPGNIVMIEEAMTVTDKSGTPPFIAALLEVMTILARDADKSWKNWIYFEAKSHKRHSEQR